MATTDEQLRKDADTLYAMGRIYCEGNHADRARNERGVCADCQEVLDYSIHRTAVCPHEHKGNCKDCSIHCYKPEMRAGIRAIMAYGAPRMMYKHPAMTARYLSKKISGKIAAKRSGEYQASRS